jgi:hypothetical protein
VREVCWKSKDKKQVESRVRDRVVQEMPSDDNSHFPSMKRKEGNSGRPEANLPNFFKPNENLLLKYCPQEDIGGALH